MWREGKLMPDRDSSASSSNMMETGCEEEEEVP